MSSINSNRPSQSLPTETQPSKTEMDKTQSDSVKDAFMPGSGGARPYVGGLDGFSPISAHGAIGDMMNSTKSGNLAGSTLEGEPVQLGGSSVEPNQLQAALLQAARQSDGNNGISVNSDPSIGASPATTSQTAAQPQPQADSPSPNPSSAQQQPSTFDKIANGISDVMPVAGGLLKDAAGLLGIK